jgi:hypothetical protein
MAIVTSASVHDFFAESVDDALRERSVETSSAARAYLIGILEDQAQPARRVDHALDRPLALLLAEAVAMPKPAERFERLRCLGDAVLYAAGFFRGHFGARGVDEGYVVRMGREAYGRARAVLVAGGAANVAQDADVFGELAGSFDAFVRVFEDVADGTQANGATSSAGVLRLYERWLRTGSDKLATALGAQGIAPMRKAASGWQ